MSNNEQTTTKNDKRTLPAEDNKKDAILSSNESKSGENSPLMQDNVNKADEAASQSSKTRKSAASKAKKTRDKRHFPWVTIIALLLVVVLGSTNYWLYQQGQQLKQAVAQMSQQQSQSNQQIKDLGEEVNDTINQQTTVVTKIQQNEQARQSMMAALDQMSEQLKALATTKGKDPLYWRVSEVEYLLTVANHRLVLERDVATAKAALQDADTRLRSIGDPGLIPVREKITQEIAQLENVTLPDIPGMAAQINSMLDILDQLPFVKKDLALDASRPDESDKEFLGLSKFFKQVWNDLVNGLFKVQRHDQPIEPLLPLEEKQYLMHNLRLKLEQARTALLQLETGLYQENLANVELWIKKYFDPDAQAVATLLEGIQNLKIAELKPALPDISPSLRELRSWLDLQKNAAYQPTNYSVAHMQLENTTP